MESKAFLVSIKDVVIIVVVHCGIETLVKGLDVISSLAARDESFLTELDEELNCRSNRFDCQLRYQPAHRVGDCDGAGIEGQARS
jgi:hypothetical protein